MDIYHSTNEKLNPRKRMKGRRGCKAGAKGSQKKLNKKDVQYLERNKTVVKERNMYLNHESRPSRFEKRNFINDGKLDYMQSESHKYSLNKKKRWELLEKLKKENGLYDYYDCSEINNIERKMDEIAEERKEESKPSHKKHSTLLLEKYHEANVKRTMSGKKKRRYIKKKREKDGVFYHYFKKHYPLYSDNTAVFMRDQLKRTDSLEKKRKRKKIKKEYGTMHGEIKNLDKNRKKRIELSEREEQMVERIRSNPDRYIFNKLDDFVYDVLRAWDHHREQVLEKSRKMKYIRKEQGRKRRIDENKYNNYRERRKYSRNMKRRKRNKKRMRIQNDLRCLMKK